jgi:pre-mRNA-splicing factor CWC26
MESGAHAGLQTAAQVSAAVKRKQREERLRFEQDGDQHVGKGAETIYRDASGKIINVAMERAKARAKQEAEEKKAREEAEAMKAPAQREQDRRRKEQLKEAKLMPFARGVDDLELNEELKERDRWADPAAGFLEKKKEGKSVTGKPLYKGPGGQVNRYGIPPGYRWDGVDRGNGFEKKWFAARAKAKGRKEMEVQWEMDE